jgi:hypothetical protein
VAESTFQSINQAFLKEKWDSQQEAQEKMILLYILRTTLGSYSLCIIIILLARLRQQNGIFKESNF